MQTQVQKLLVILVLLTVLVGCSRKKDKFLSRNFHAITAEYNTLFNGRQAFEQGRDALIEGYQDNFWAILPIERLDSPDFVPLPGEAIDPSFKIAEEKAVKAIQKHSMEINGTERNPQIDEAFMLLGKARYYDLRFLRALEAFNYILSYYPASDNIAQAKIWKAKTQIRLDNTKLAIASLHKLLEEEDALDRQDFADASAMLAQGYIFENRLDSALVYIEKAAYLTRKNEEKGRYYFIKGQLYDNIGQNQLANANYDKVIDLNRRSPRRYMINAYINKIRNFDYETGDQERLFELLTDLEENRENRPYLDIIQYQFAEFYRNVGREDSAVAYYNKSIASQGEDKYLTSRDYLSLGDLNFNNSEYLIAGAYYDSTLAFIPENTREYRNISKKRENLSDVILYEGIATRNDSILNLVYMNDTDRQAYFESYITALKEQKAKDSIAEANAEAAIANNEFFVANNPNSGPNPPGGSSGFYFYNPVQVAQGKLDFKQRWGSRENADNWRVSSSVGSALASNEIAGEKDLLEEVDNGIYNADNYINKIPSEQPIIDSISTARNFAYYQLGLIYKEKLKEPQLAIQRLEALLAANPEERLVLPAKYNLYQLYEASGDTFNSDKYKFDILQNYGDTRYASIINNPDKALEQDQNSPEVLYNNLYRDFENQEYARVITQANRYIDEYAGDAFVPKFELLKATAIGRSKGYDAYEQALNYVALNYPNQEEGKKAKELLEKALPQLKNNTFVADAEAKKYNLLYTFKTSEKNTLLQKQDSISNYLKQNNFTQLSASRDVYDEATQFLALHGFKSKVEALYFAERLKEAKLVAIEEDQEPVVVSSANYRIIQLHKNLEAYKNLDSQ
ncbi:hypothetical protein LDL79_06955 [Leeuwenhoekiella palythoae]|uniref:type IX secretion system periplasmic lipoprotein PorW/SprE n=1 Tax=Leeuwenhoekiella palythoae TaxID=573501 RepID=UPI001CE0E041|nr:hypothetical protein [Leeuwenhoekiella palythoae]UBZ11849.1 hypothetical protein LDL79_06955 [Leeuwenhoekiella palythoae]